MPYAPGIPAAYEGLQLVGTHTVSQFGAPEPYIDLNGVYSLTNMVIRIQRMIPVVDAASLRLRVYDSNGILQTGAADYSWGNRNTSATAAADVFDAADSEIKLLSGNNAGNGAGENWNGEIRFCNLADLSNFKPFKYEMWGISAGGVLLSVAGSGSYIASQTDIPQIRLDFHNGDIQEAIVSLYSYAQ